MKHAVFVNDEVVGTFPFGGSAGEVAKGEVAKAYHRGGGNKVDVGRIGVSCVPIAWDLGLRLSKEMKLDERWRVTLRRNWQRDGSFLWSIWDGDQYVFSKSEQEFVFANLPSSRTSEELDDTRFKTMREALDAYCRWLEENDFEEVK